MPSVTSANHGLCRSLSNTPIVIVLRDARLRAIRFGRYPSLVAASVTRLRDSMLTRGESRITNDTKARETPAIWATSSNVGAWFRRVLDTAANLVHLTAPLSRLELERSN